MKRLLSLLLVLCLFLPSFSLAELDEEEISFEDVDLDEEGEEEADSGPSAEVIEAEQLSEEEKEEMKAVLASSDYVPAELETTDLFINRNLPENVINILLLGIDSRSAEYVDEEVKLADVQIILSFNLDTGSIKLSSILRDTLVDNPITSSQSPINYSLRSFDKNGKFHNDFRRAVATVNCNFDLNIENYVMVNFRGVAAIVDKVGGIDLDLTEGEAANINYYLKKNAKSISRHYDTKEAKAARVELEVRDGVQHLDGLQALMYARLRQNKTRKSYNLGDDWQRTFRTRNLLDKLLQKVLKKDVWDIIDLAGESIEFVESNMNLGTMSDLILKVLGSGIVQQIGSSDSIIEQFRIPMGNADDGTKTWTYVQDKQSEWYGKVFMSKRNGNFQANVEGLHEFIYGKYYPSDSE